MDGLVLSRNELLVLLDAVQAQTIIGVDGNRIIPSKPDEQRSMIVQGQASLKERGLLQVAPDGIALDPVLLTLAVLLTDPTMAIVLVRQLPEQGYQAWHFYQRENFIAEYTQPDEATHRLASIPNPEQLILRIAQILPLETGITADPAVISEADFNQAKSLAEQRQTEQAVTLLSKSFGLDAARGLVAAIQEPLFSASLALLRCADREVIDARSMALLQGQTSAWLIRQKVAGETDLEIMPTNQLMIAQQVVDWFQELLTVAG